MSGVGTISTLLSTLVPDTVGTQPVTEATGAAQPSTSERAEKTSTPTPIYASLPFQQLTLELMGLGNPVNSADYAALLTDLQSKFDEYDKELRDAKARNAATSARSAFTLLAEQAGSLTLSASERIERQAKIDSDNAQIATLTTMGSALQLQYVQVGNTLETASQSLQAAQDSLAATDPSDPTYTVLVSARDAAQAIVSDLNQQKASLDLQIAANDQALASVRSDLETQQAAITVLTETLATQQSAFISLYVAMATSAATDDPMRNVLNRGLDLLRDDRIEQAQAADAAYAAILAAMGQGSAVQDLLSVSPAATANIKPALLLLMTAAADAATGFNDLMAHQRPPPDPLAGLPRLTISA